MATMGLDSLIVKGPDGKAHQMGHSRLGTQKIDLKGIEGNETALNGSNQVQLYYKEPSHPVATVTVNDIEPELLAQLVGANPVQEGGGLYAEGQTSVSPVSGICIVSPKLGEDKDVIFVLPKCYTSYQQLSMTTNTESKRNIAPVQLTFSGAYDAEIKASIIWGEVEHGKAADAVSKLLNWPEPEDDGEYKDAGSAVIAPKRGN